MVYLLDRDFARHRTLIVRVAAILLLAEWVSHAAPHSLLSWADLAHPAGIGLILLGVAVRSWAAGYLIKSRSLTTTGPYAVIRHPLNLGSLLLMLGFGLTLEDGLAITAVIVLFGILYLPAIIREEQRLSRTYADHWISYSERTGMLWPKGWRLNSANGWHWHLWVRNKEWACVLVSALFLLALQTASWI